MRIFTISRRQHINNLTVLGTDIVKSMALGIVVGLFGIIMYTSGYIDGVTDSRQSIKRHAY